MSDRPMPASDDEPRTDLDVEHAPGASDDAEAGALERHGNVGMEDAELRQKREPDRANRDLRP